MKKISSTKSKVIKPKVTKAKPKYSPIHLFVFFGYNYNYDFIQKIWGNDNIGKHMKSKFDHIYKRDGVNAVMNSFYSELDGGNRKLLETYILKNYKG